MPLNALDYVVGAFAGTLISIGIARYYLIKSLKDLEAALQMCHKINERLSAINVQIDSLNRMFDLVFDHDRKISVLESYRARSRN